MYQELLFHGSNRDRGRRILEHKKLEPSKGNNHWLGDGSYFFTEGFYSYKWIVDMYRHRYGTDITYCNLIKHYIILIGNINITKDRIFDLTKAEHKIIFDKVENYLNENKMIKSEIAEGVVINYMFTKLTLSENFDAVKAVFMLNGNKYKDLNTRIGYLPQEQICIKNSEVVQNIKEYDFREEEKHYKRVLENMYYKSTVENNIKYSHKQPYSFSKRRSE